MCDLHVVNSVLFLAPNKYNNTTTNYSKLVIVARSDLLYYILTVELSCSPLSHWWHRPYTITPIWHRRGPVTNVILIYINKFQLSSTYPLFADGVVILNIDDLLFIVSCEIDHVCLCSYYLSHAAKHNM